MKIEVEVGGIATVSGKEYVVNSYEIVRRARRNFSNETVTLVLLELGDGYVNQPPVEIAFCSCPQGGDVQSD